MNLHDLTPVPGVSDLLEGTYYRLTLTNIATTNEGVFGAGNITHRYDPIRGYLLLDTPIPFSAWPLSNDEWTQEDIDWVSERIEELSRYEMDMTGHEIHRALLP